MKPQLNKLLITLSSAVCICFCACSTQVKATKTKENKKTESMEILNTYSVSALTKMFIEDVNKEIKESKSTINNYTPSDELIEKFGIRKLEESYFVSGFINTDETFDQTKLQERGMHLGHSSGEIKTINFDIKQLSELLNFPGINYFEISGKAELKLKH